MIVHLVKGLRFVTFADWTWLAAKTIAAGIMPIAVIVSAHDSQSVRTRTVSLFVLDLLMYLMISGGLLSIFGILLRGTRVRPLIVGYAFELGGLVPLVLGPLLLAIIYTVSAIATGGSMVGPMLCLGLSALFFARATDILTQHLMPKRDNDAQPPRHKGE